MVEIVAVCTFILFDIITGLIKALYLNGLNSTYLRKGLFHKLSEIIAVIGAFLLEYGIQYIQLGIDVPLLKATTAYICLMELISILENLAEVNPTLGRFFKPYLEKLKNKGEEDNE